MSRSGYREDSSDNWAVIRCRGAVASAMRGQRGDAFLHEMLEALDALPVKELHAYALIHEDCVCALGAVAVARKLKVDPLLLGPDPGFCATDMAELFGIPRALAAEIMHENDEGTWGTETPEARFRRMREWIVAQIEANEKRAEVTK